MTHFSCEQFLPSLTSVDDDEEEEVEDGKGERLVIIWLMGAALFFEVPEIKKTC